MKPKLKNLYEDIITFLKLDNRYKNSFVMYMNVEDIFAKTNDLFNFPSVFVKITPQNGKISIGGNATTFESCGLDLLYINNNANPSTNFLNIQDEGDNLITYFQNFKFNSNYENISYKPSFTSFDTDSNNDNFFKVYLKYVFYWKQFKNYDKIPIDPTTIPIINTSIKI